MPGIYERKIKWTGLKNALFVAAWHAQQLTLATSAKDTSFLYVATYAGDRGKFIHAKKIRRRLNGKTQPARTHATPGICGQ